MNGNDESAALFDQATLYRKQGRPGAALAVTDRLLQRHPDMPALNGERGAILIDMGDHAGALQSFEAALERDPGNALYQNLAGVCLQALGRRDEALASYDRAI